MLSPSTVNLKERKFYANFNDQNLEINISLKNDLILISTEIALNIFPSKFFCELNLSKLKTYKIFDNLDTIEDIFNYILILINNNEISDNKSLVQNINNNNNKNNNKNNENKENENKENKNNNIILTIPTNIKKFNSISFELKKINNLNNDFNYLFNMIKKLQKEKDDLQKEIQENYVKKTELPNYIDNYYNYYIKKIIFKESKIILPNENELICNWIEPNKIIEAKFLYRASIDGDSSKDFHDKCDNKGMTICFFKLGNGRRIGGFTSISWSMKGGSKKDPNAFIFSMDNKEKYSLRNKNGNSVYHSNKNGPMFWNGVNVGDIVVKQDCLVREAGIQIFNQTYETSVFKLIGVQSDGCKLMKLEDYEVFQISFKN